MSLVENVKQTSKSIVMKIVNSLYRALIRMEGALAIVIGLMIIVYAWYKKPDGVIQLTETAITALKKDWVSNLLLFYGGIVAAIVFMVYGFVKLMSLERNNSQQQNK